MTASEPGHLTAQLSGMRQVRLVVIDQAGYGSDWTVTWAGWHPTVGDLAAALDLPAAPLRIGGQECLIDELLDAIDLFDGIEVAHGSHRATPNTGPPSAGTPIGGRLRVDQIAGIAAGARLDLVAGPMVVQQTTSNEESSHLRPPQVAPPVDPGSGVGAGPVRVHIGPDPGSVESDQRRVWDTGQVKALGADLFEVLGRPGNSSTDTPGSLRRRPHVVHRQPRLMPARSVPLAVVPTVPSEPSPPAPFSWMLLLVPIPIGLLIAVLFRPYFLLFTMMGPLMSVARWAEGRRRFNKSMRSWVGDCERLESQLRDEVDRARRAEIRRRRDQQPTIAELGHRSMTAASELWERREPHDDFMQLCLGYHNVNWQASDTEHELGATVLDLVPLVVDLGPGQCLGIVGHRETAEAVARALLVQATVLHGPADLVIELALSPPDLSRWDWGKWLPHLGAFGDREVACRLLLGGTPAHEQQVQPRPGADAGTTRDARIELAPTIAELPSSCSTVVTCGDSLVELLDTTTGDHVCEVVPVGCTGRFASRIARAMAPLRDPEFCAVGEFAPDDGVGAGGNVALIDLLERATPGLAAPEAGNSLVGPEQHAAGDGLQAIIGHDAELVTIDLVTDGPHALVAGMTGSGKSEFLRTLVVSLAHNYSPGDCSFVLVDFKGGGAFDVVAGLPHVSSVVTDLDAAGAQRALTSLRAELRDRETRLRQVGASDLAAYRRAGHDDLGRLVLIVDEFATLAADLPDFLSGLVDIAQRGRSLGVHLVLATQRPAGVLDNKIRANTNLRVCLRVHDPAESRDVVGVTDAAEIPSRAVGRAVLRVGVEPVRTFQCAHIGDGQAKPAPGSLHVAAFVGGALTPTGKSAPLFENDAETQSLVDRLCVDAARAGVANAGTLWLEPLQPEPDTAEFWRNVWTTPDCVPLGRADIPDERAQPVWTWAWSQGPLAVIGGSAEDRKSIVELIAGAVGFARERWPTQEAARAHDEPPSRQRQRECYVIGDLAAQHGSESTPVITSDDVEGISRVIDRCAQVAAQPAEPGPSVVVIIHDYAQLAASEDPKDRAALLARLESVLADRSGNFAIVLLGSNERSIPLRVLSSVHQRVILRLTDTTGYATFGIRSRDLPALGELGGVDSSSCHLIQLARPPVDVDLASIASEVRRCPEFVDPGCLPVGTAVGATVTIPIGLNLHSLEPASLSLSGGTVAVVGAPQSGRTTVLCAIADAVRLACSHAHITAVAAAPSPHQVRGSLALNHSVHDVLMYERVPGGGNARDLSVRGAADRSSDGSGLAAWLEHGLDRIGESQTTAPWVILIDDASQLPADYGAALLALVDQTDAVTVVVAGTAEDFRSVRSWCSSARARRSGIVLSRDRSDGDVFKNPLMSYPGVPWQPGDATLVSGSCTAAIRCSIGRLG